MPTTKATRAQIVEVLANPEYKTYQERATVLGIKYESLWKRLKDDPTIQPEADELIRAETANTVAVGFQRMYRIIDKGDDPDAIRALRLLLEYRGELKKTPTGSEDDPIHYVVDYLNADDNGN